MTTFRTYEEFTVGCRVRIVVDCTHGEDGEQRLARGHSTVGAISGGPAPMYSQRRTVANIRVTRCEPETEDGMPTGAFRVTVE